MTAIIGSPALSVHYRATYRQDRRPRSQPSRSLVLNAISVNAMLGLPRSRLPPASLPAYAELIAFVTHDDDPLVDLWLRQRNAPPRAYETTLNNKAQTDIT